MKSLWCILFCSSMVLHAQNLTQYVNPFIGTGGHGHTWPGATVPFGAVQLSPDTRPDGYNDWDGCGGYHYSDSIIYGFSHTHLSGTGVADYCDILLMPGVGTVQMQNIQENDVTKGYASAFDHSTEIAKPGYYSVLLEDDSIRAELTTTTRTGMHAYTFPKDKDAYIILDLMHRDKLLEGSFIEIISPTKVQGLRRSSSWARDQWVYFAIEFSQPFFIAGIDNKGSQSQTTANFFKPQIVSGTALKSFFRFRPKANMPLYVKCAVSSVSCSGAWNNMQTENPAWNFTQVAEQADQLWNTALQKIVVQSPAEEKRSLQDPDNKLVIFYTALYHCMLAPYVFEDADGRYRGMDGAVHTSPDHTQYTVFSLWDTFRALHPLLTIIEPERTSDFINTFLHQYAEGGRLPVWELSANETECMIGYHSVSVIADAYAKGIRGFDAKLALEAMLHSANDSIFGLIPYNEKGFIESNEEPESVSRTLEYAYDDWCIGTFAQQLGDDRANTYLQRGANFVHLINADGFVQPRTNGGWYTPFDPYEVNFNFTEANSWQYAFFYPQYLTQINTTEQKDLLEKRLDALFKAQSETTGRQQADITGLIGQYAHGNEPSHHIAYLYNYTNAPYKTQEMVHTIRNDFYKNAPDGLIGNEDCGQMSAWYVMSALGLYAVCPGKPEYDLVTPMFEKAIIQSGKNTFEILSLVDGKQMSPNKYLHGVKLNGKSTQALHIAHSTIAKGGSIQLETGLMPSNNVSRSFDTNDQIFYEVEKAPLILASSATFTKSLTISIDGEDDQVFRYRINQGPFVDYTGPFDITQTSTIHALAFDQAKFVGSTVVKAKFVKIPQHFSVEYITQYNNQYTGGGDAALVDGLHGGVDFRTGMWQGWWGEDMLLQIDLGKNTYIDTVGAEFLQDIRSWIWMPAMLTVEGSTDGKNFTTLTIIRNSISGEEYDSKEIAQFLQNIPPTEVRFLRFRAHNPGPVPDWHPGKGGKSWIFCDEIWIK